MSKLTGIFESLKDLESISADEVNRYLDPRQDPHIIENHLANLIIYPQSIPSTKDSMNFDIAILKAYAYKFSAFFYIKDQKKMIVPTELCNRFGSIEKTCYYLIEGLKLGEITQIYLKDNQNTKLLGTAITRFIQNSQANVSFFLDDKEYKSSPGACMRYQLKDHHIRFHFGAEEEKVIPGGVLGVIVLIKDID